MSDFGDEEYNEIQAMTFAVAQTREQREPLCSAYALWKQNWTEAYRELNQMRATDVAYGDNFSRQSLVLSLFFDRKCVATACLRSLDLTLSFHRDDSYLKDWPETFLEELSATGKILILSGFTLDPKYRIKISGLPSIYLFHSYIVHFFMQTSFQRMITISRNDVGINKLVRKYNANAIKENIPYANTTADLILYKREEVEPFPFKKYEKSFFKIISRQNSIFFTNNLEIQTGESDAEVICTRDDNERIFQAL